MTDTTLPAATSDGNRGEKKMRTWLVCNRCGTKEWLQPHTGLVGCPDCGAPRFAENDDGDPVFLFSGLNNLTSWDLSKFGVCGETGNDD